MKQYHIPKDIDIKKAARGVGWVPSMERYIGKTWQATGFNAELNAIQLDRAHWWPAEVLIEAEETSFLNILNL